MLKKKRLSSSASAETLDESVSAVIEEVLKQLGQSLFGNGGDVDWDGDRAYVGGSLFFPLDGETEEDPSGHAEVSITLEPNQSGEGYQLYAYIQSDDIALFDTQELLGPSGVVVSVPEDTLDFEPKIKEGIDAFEKEVRSEEPVNQSKKREKNMNSKVNILRKFIRSGSVFLNNCQIKVGKIKSAFQIQSEDESQPLEEIAEDSLVLIAIDDNGDVHISPDGENFVEVEVEEGDFSDEEDIPEDALTEEGIDTMSGDTTRNGGLGPDAGPASMSASRKRRVRSNTGAQTDGIDNGDKGTTNTLGPDGKPIQTSPDNSIATGSDVSDEGKAGLAKQTPGGLKNDGTPPTTPGNNFKETGELTDDLGDEVAAIPDVLESGEDVEAAVIEIEKVSPDGSVGADILAFSSLKSGMAHTGSSYKVTFKQKTLTAAGIDLYAEGKKLYTSKAVRALVQAVVAIRSMKEEMLVEAQTMFDQGDNRDKISFMLKKQFPDATQEDIDDVIYTIIDEPVDVKQGKKVQSAKQLRKSPVIAGLINKTFVLTDQNCAYICKSGKFAVTLIKASLVKGLNNSKFVTFTKIGSSYMSNSGYVFDAKLMQTSGYPKFVVVADSNKKFFEKKGVASGKYLDSVTSQIDVDYFKKVVKAYNSKMAVLQRKIASMEEDDENDEIEASKKVSIANKKITELVLQNKKLQSELEEQKKANASLVRKQVQARRVQIQSAVASEDEINRRADALLRAYGG